MARLEGTCIVVVAAAVVWLPVPLAPARSVLDVRTLSQYIDPLPNPLRNVIAPAGTLDGAPLYEVSITQFQQRLHSELPATTLWGYNGSYPGADV